MIKNNGQEGVNLPGDDPGGTIIKRIGKDTPDYYTYNYNPSGQFTLSDGIPTSEDVRNGYWYTPDGRRISGQPQRKGIYINNGQKIVIK